MTRVVILARNNDKPANLEIVNFLEKNMTDMVKNGFRFELKVVEDKDIEKLLSKGIDKLPYAQINNKPFKSSSEIITALMRCKNPQQKTQTMEEDFREYFKDDMTEEAAERDSRAGDDDSEKQSMIERANAETERRQREFQRRTGKTKKTPQRQQQDPDTEQAGHRPNTRPMPSNPKNNVSADDDLILRMLEESESGN